MFSVQLNDRKRSTNMMLTLGLIETIDQLAIVKSVCWYGHVLRTKSGHVLRRTLDIELEGQWKKVGQRRHGTGRLKKKV